jgi:hypothetical protein
VSPNLKKKKKKMFRKSVSIDLVEPVICLRGKPKDKQTLNILRGAIRLELSHSAIVHSITIQFIGTSKTLWPEGNIFYVFEYLLLFIYDCFTIS